MFYSNSIRLTAFFSNFSTIPQKDKPALFLQKQESPNNKTETKKLQRQKVQTDIVSVKN